jgi:hypothetical protein
MNAERVTDLLADAVAAVEAANVPEGLREAAFTGALQLLAGEQLAVARSGAVEPPSAEQIAPRSDPVGAGSSVLDRVAAGLELDSSKVVRLFDEKDGAPELIVKAKDLPTAKSDAARDIALLVMAARQLGGIEEYTEANVLRDACKRYSSSTGTTSLAT